MIQEFVQIWDKYKGEIEDQFREDHPGSYGDIVEAVITMLHKHSENEYCKPDPKKIHLIDDGYYQGTLLFVIPEDGYQPHEYWYVRVWYGSCSGCDTLERIRSEGWYDENEAVKEKQVKEYMMLALNVLQELKKMGE